MRTPIARSAGATAGPDDGLHEDGLGAVRARMRAVMKFPIIIPAIGTRELPNELVSAAAGVDRAAADTGGDGGAAPLVLLLHQVRAAGRS